MEIGPERKSADYESHYAIGEGKQTSNDGVNLPRFIVCLPVQLLGETRGGRSDCSAADMLSSEEASVDRPGAGSNHGQGATQKRQYD
jgi:hypothetical protein